MSDLVEFLRARLDEDESLAKAASQHDVWADADGWADGAWVETFHADVQVHALRHGPARVLADVEAKRKLISNFEHYDSIAKYPDSDGGMAIGLQYAVELAALPYADHDDYRDEWRPA